MRCYGNVLCVLVVGVSLVYCQQHSVCMSIVLKTHVFALHNSVVFGIQKQQDLYISGYFFRL